MTEMFRCAGSSRVQNLEAGKGKRRIIIVEVEGSSPARSLGLYNGSQTTHRTITSDFTLEK